MHSAIYMAKPQAKPQAMFISFSMATLPQQV